MKLSLRLWVAIALTLAGLLLLYLGFWVKPRGIIDSSVLIAFGEVSTFAGSLFGIDYYHRAKRTQVLP